jgi:conjugative relaxase-like TrwC/TraI family protein
MVMTVSFAKVRTAGGASNYFTQDNYYSLEQGEATSEWGGKGAEGLGLQGEVKAEIFEKLLNGTLPDGTQVGDPRNRALGSDITFSAPKSVSLLALVTGDKRIVEAHLEAVKTAMAWGEKHLSEARIKTGDTAVPIRTGNLTYALFPHDTSRALDPQLHVHAVTANVTQLPEKFRNPDKANADGTVTKDHGWRAWHNGLFIRNNPVLRTIYHSSLRAGIDKLGYETVGNGKYANFEIDGVNQDSVVGYSKRAAQVNEKANQLGLQSDKARDKITVTTRDDKIKVEDRVQLQADWRGEGEQYGYNGDEIYAAALTRAAEPTNPVARATKTVGRIIADARDNLSEYLRRPNDPLVDKGLSKLALSPAEIRTQYTVASAIRIQSEKEAAFDHAALVKSALELSQRGVTVELVEARIEQLTKRGELVPEKSTRLDGAIDKVTTREAIQTERRILSSIEEGRGEARPLVPVDKAPELLQSLSTRGELGRDQLAAAVAIVSSKDRIVVVQGRAGSGKSTMLQPVAKAEILDAAGHALQSMGKDALLLTVEQRGNAEALAFQNKMVADLRADTGMKASTLHSFIGKYGRHLDEATSPQGFAAAKSELKGRYLLLDEASMVSATQMDRLIRIANLFEVGRLAIIGDQKQLSSIEWGKAFSTIQAAMHRAGERFPHVTENRRQAQGAMQNLADAADRGDLRKAFSALGANIIENGEPTRAAARAWLALSPAERDKTVLLPSGRAGRAEANATIQQGLKAEGTLKGEGIALQVRERADVEKEQMRYGNFWREAQLLEVSNENNQLGLKRGDYRIASINRNGKVALRDAHGKWIKVDPLKLDPAKPGYSLRLANEKTIRIHEGDKLRWTDNDKKRGLSNQTLMEVKKIDRDGVTLKLADGKTMQFDLKDPMLKRIDLAYAINTPMAQGITRERVMGVMQSWERNLSNIRSFLVNFTRQKFEAILFTDDKAKLQEQLKINPGNKTSALESIGVLPVDQLLKDHDPARAGRGSPAQSRPSVELGPGSRETRPTPAADSRREAIETSAKADAKAKEHKPAETTKLAPEEPQLDKSKGMEL